MDFKIWTKHFSFLKWSIPTSPVFVGQIECGSWCFYHSLPTVILPELCISETRNSNLLLSSYSSFSQKGEQNDLILASLMPNSHPRERDLLSPYHRLKWGHVIYILNMTTISGSSCCMKHCKTV